MAQMLTAKQVAEVKGCSPRYIKKIIQDGKLIAEIGKLTWYRWMRWMKNCSTSFTR